MWAGGSNELDSTFFPVSHYLSPCFPVPLSPFPPCSVSNIWDILQFFQVNCNYFRIISYLCSQKQLIMSPVFRRESEYTFKIYSNEEERMHIHVLCGGKEAKFWLEPQVELAKNSGKENRREICRQLQRTIPPAHRQAY